MDNISFDKIIEKVFDSFRKITPALVAVAIMSGLILFLPTSILDDLGLSNLPETIKSILGLLLLLSCTLIFTILMTEFFQLLIKHIKRKKTLIKLKKRYLKLSDAQKRIIVRMMKSSSKSIELDYTSGDTLYLKENNFIFMPQQYIDPYVDEYIYAPHPWLMELFQKHPNLFDLNKDIRKKSGD